MAEQKKRNWWRIFRKLFIWVFLVQLAYILFCKWIDPPITITQMVSVVEGDGLKRDYIDYDDMGMNIKLAVIASEDQLFTEHNGFDTSAIKKAIKYNKTHKRKRGASTISQQTAKNVFLWQHGGYFRKGLEVYFTFMIETVWSKKRVLETYLNVAEMGRGIYGVQAAAKAYFKKDAKDLTRQEAAMIAACLPNPKKYTISPLSKYVAGRTPKIMRQMGFLDDVPDILELIK